MVAVLPDFVLFFKKSLLGLWKWVKCLQLKHEVLSLDFQQPCKSQAWWHIPVIPLHTSNTETESSGPDEEETQKHLNDIQGFNSVVESITNIIFVNLSYKILDRS